MKAPNKKVSDKRLYASHVARERIKAARRQLFQRWHEDANKLLTDAGVPEWVEVGGVPGNSLPHRLEWFILRRKNVSEVESAGVCDDLNAMEDFKPNRELADDDEQSGATTRKEKP